MARKLRILYDGAICRVAFSGNVLVTADGIVTALTTDAAVPRLGLDYRLAAVTPRGLKRGIAGACSGTNPLQPDTDGDCMTDGWEVRHDFNPREVQTDGIHGAGDDPDGDGLSNLEECQHGTDPFNPDTDGDGVWDGDEVPHSPGSCPSDASDNGSSTNCVTLKLTVGDPSGSNSERWNLEVFEEATGRAVARHCDDGFGTPGSAEHSLVKGKAYTFSLRRVATNRGNHTDYDWRALINNSTEAGAYSGLYGTGAFIVEANRIYRQVAVTFVLESVQNVHGHDLWFHIGDAVEFFQMTSYTNGTGGA